jgi:hypothetical protein
LINTHAPTGCRRTNQVKKGTKNPARHIGTSRNISLVPGTGLEPASLSAADFHHTASFDAGADHPIASSPFVRWTMPSPSRQAARVCLAALGAPRLVSTPSATRAATAACEGLGSALPRRDRARFHAREACARMGARGFAEFEGFCTDRFRPGTQTL